MENKTNKNLPGNGSLSKGAKAGWFILSFCVPIVGLILWLVWMKEEPEKSKYCRNGFIASVIAAVVMYVSLFILSTVLLSSMSMSLPG
ncbi:MAG: hypothetical protein Q4G33_07895 [bacterium]|nr:hypothetical protein [bacterium]